MAKSIKIQRKPVSFKWYPPTLIERDDDGELAVVAGSLKDLPYILATRLSKRVRVGIADSAMYVEVGGQAAVSVNGTKVRLTPASASLDYCVASIRGFSGFVDEDGFEVEYNGSEGDIDALLDALEIADYEEFSQIADGNITAETLAGMKNVVIVGETVVN